MDLFRKKSVDQLVAESTPLKRTMRTFDLTMLGIGAIIGTGIFVLTGKGALTAGPALSVSFLLAAVCCGFAGLCYAEFAAMAPVSGSAYSYAYLAFGELIAFVIGWDLILEYALQAATVSAGWSGYFNKLLEGFGLHLPVELTAAYGTTPGVTTYFNLPGFVIVLIITSTPSSPAPPSRTASCRPRRSCSSASSASTPSPPPPRRPSTRTRRCRAVSCSRWPSPLCSTSS